MNWNIFLAINLYHNFRLSFKKKVEKLWRLMLPIVTLYSYDLIRQYLK